MKTTTNKKIGNDFESELCDMFAAKGYWAHNFAQKSSGQPCDIIVQRDNDTYLIDAKVCSDGSFKLSRVEDNQIRAMKLFYNCGGNPGFFALKLGEEVFLVPLGVISKLPGSTINDKTIRSRGITFEEFTQR